jgi:hypothetical protein
MFIGLIRTQLVSCKVMGAIDSLFFYNKGKSDCWGIQENLSPSKRRVLRDS